MTTNFTRKLNKVFKAAHTDTQKADIKTLIKKADRTAKVTSTIEGEEYSETITVTGGYGDVARPGDQYELPRQSVCFAVENKAGEKALVSAVRVLHDADLPVFKAHAF